MLGYAALKPDRSPLGIYPDMASAQQAIAADEPDVLKQSLYQIHPISAPRDVDALSLKLKIHFELVKFDLDGNVIEIREGEG